MENIDVSLRRLNTDYLDQYEIHRVDPSTAAEETMEALHDICQARRPVDVGLAASQRAAGAPLRRRRNAATTTPEAEDTATTNPHLNWEEL